MDQKLKELKWEAYFISSQEELYDIGLRKPICMTPNTKAKAVPMDSWWVHNPAGPEASLDWQTSRASLCDRVRMHLPSITCMYQRESNGNPQTLHAPGQVPHSSAFPTGLSLFTALTWSWLSFTSPSLQLTAVGNRNLNAKNCNRTLT